MVILASTWEAALVTSIFALSNGGTGGVSFARKHAACFALCIKERRHGQKISDSTVSGNLDHFRLLLRPALIRHLHG